MQIIPEQKKQYLEKGSYGDKTFYGRYKIAEYTIEYYNIEGCTNTEDLPVKHVHGSKTDLIEPKLPLYKFLGWYADADFENPITSIPANYNGTSTIKLYAKKVLELIPISYKDSKGNDLVASSFNSTPPISYDYENGTQLVEAHKNGYTFDGWYNTIECTGKPIDYLGAEEYTTAVVLYCKFTPILYSITYYVDGVENTNTGNPSSYIIEDLPITLKSLTKEGYNSIGWRRNSSVSTTVVKQITYLDNWNLYWVWEPNVVTITWDANGGIVEPATSQYTYDGDVVSIPTPLDRAGYTFNGWYTSKSGGTKITEIGTTNKPTKNVTYYAQWSKQSYTLTWNPNGGTIPSSPAYTSGNVEYGTSITKPGNPTKNYYVFTNWKDQYGNTNVAATMPAKNLTYTAQYEGKTITIKWDPNCSELTTLITTYKYGEPVEPQNLIRTGYVFVGWSTTQDGSNIQSTFGGTTVTADSITYYAVWSVQKYYVKVTATEGGTATGGNRYYNYLEECYIEAIPNDGYRFVKWIFNENDEEIHTSNIMLFGVDQDYDIVAVFEKIEEIEIEPLECIKLLGIDLLPHTENKISTFKWINNALGEPEKTEWTEYREPWFKDTLDLSIYNAQSTKCIIYDNANIDLVEGNIVKKYVKESDILYYYSEAPQIPVIIGEILTENNCINFTTYNLLLGESEDLEWLIPPVYLYFTVNDNASSLYKIKLPFNKYVQKHSVEVPDVSNISSIQIKRCPCIGLKDSDGYTTYCQYACLILLQENGVSITEQTLLKNVVLTTID